MLLAFDRGCARCLLAESHNIIELNRMTPRILIVEDDPDIAQLVVRYLDRGGFTTELTASGRDAIAAISQRPPDLLVLDLMLPHVDGLAVCRVVRANKATASLPIIMLTARARSPSAF
jgi:DNA-binding response OmpR family regulator